MSSSMAWYNWDVERAADERPLLDARRMQFPLVVEIAVSRGFPAQALRFAESLTDPVLRSECEIAWADAATRAKFAKIPREPVSLDSLVSKLKPAAQSRLHARVGTVHLWMQVRTGASAALKAAIDSLGKIDVGPEATVPSLKALVTFVPSDPTPQRQQALALAEIARLEGGLDDKTDARKHLASALGLLRASAPSPAAVDARLQEREKQNSIALRKEFRKQLKLANDDAAVRAYNACRHNGEQLLIAAQSRFDLQIEILQSALAWDDPAEIWKEIGPRAVADDVNQKETYFTTVLPWQLAILLERSGKKELASTIREAAEANSIPPAAGWCNSSTRRRQLTSESFRGSCRPFREPSGSIWSGRRSSVPRI